MHGEWTESRPILIQQTYETNVRSTWLKFFRTPDQPSCLLLGHVANYIPYTHSFSVNCYIVVTQERIIDELSLDMDSTANRLDFVQVFFFLSQWKKDIFLHFFSQPGSGREVVDFCKKRFADWTFVNFFLHKRNQFFGVLLTSNLLLIW